MSSTEVNTKTLQTPQQVDASTNNNLQLFCRFLLTLILIVTTVRFVGFIVRFIDENLQMDFAAFYTAGEALNAGLSPYRTHLQTNPPIWDGISEFLTSRFLYPPLVATFFQPLARLDYATAKILWTLLGLLCLLLSLWLVNRQSKLERTPTFFLAFGILFTTYYPLLTYLERGQIDAINLLLLTIAILALVSAKHSSQLVAGMLIAFATLLKLQCIYFVPFLLWRRQWLALLGFGIGGVFLLTLSIGFNGVGEVTNYLRVEMPRIAQYGDLGAIDQLMDPVDWQILHAGLEDGYTQKDQRHYLPEAFFFTKNATTVRNLHSILRRFVPTISQTIVSLLALTGFAACLIAWDYLHGAHSAVRSARQQFFYWQLVLLIIMLAGPMTWIMNLIWLLPLTLALLAELQLSLSRQPLSGHSLSARQSLMLALAFFAILLTALPDIHTFPLLFPTNSALFRWQYIFAELLLFGALLLYWGELDGDELDGDKLENNPTKQENLHV